MAPKDRIIRIALTGPESSAKSTLSEQLAQHYHTVWVEEYAREYLGALDRKYTADDIVAIAQKQLELEHEALKKANKLLFSDTELLLIKVWCEDVFKTTPAWISENILPNRYDLYLLTYPDIEWEYDPLRENPHRREFLFEWYKKELEAIGANYAVIRGLGDARLQHCISAIENFLSS
jgi:NadR type nicotinamide-nucleotide adenylyltransferase